MRDVYVVGAAMTAFGKHHDRSLRSLAEEAAHAALADAHAAPDDVDAVFFANASAGLITGQEMIRGQVALRRTGLLGAPIVNVENACASGSTALHLARIAVGSGAAEVAIVVGAEKMTHSDTRRTFAALNGALDRAEYDLDITRRSPFMELYADLSRNYARRTGATDEDFAAVAVKSRANAARNPHAQYRIPVTIDDVVTSRVVADPLRLLMCSPVGDGAAALVLCGKEAHSRIGAHSVLLASTVVLSARDHEGHDVVARAAQTAYVAAGIRPDEVDVVEVHDAVAPAELIVTDALGIAAPFGGSVAFLRAGDSSLDGTLPVNPSGGLLSKGHPIGATGCAQVVELVDQLRGRCGDRQVNGARVALAENAGGWLGTGPALACVSILREP